MESGMKKSPSINQLASVLEKPRKAKVGFVGGHMMFTGHHDTLDIPNTRLRRRSRTVIAQEISIDKKSKDPLGDLGNSSGIFGDNCTFSDDQDRAQNEFNSRLERGNNQ